MKTIIKIMEDKYLLFSISVISIFILISTPLCFAQRMLLDDSVENKNLLFELLRVKKQKIQYNDMRMSDSVLISESSQILNINSAGYVTKEEDFNPYYNPSNSVLEYNRDKNGNIIQIISHGKLVESKTYNDLNKVTQWCFYKADTLFNKWNIKYDFLGNQIELLIKYPSGKIDTGDTRFYEYNNQSSTPKILKETRISDGDTDIYIYDKNERLVKKIHRDYYYNTRDSTLYFHNELGSKDSIVDYSTNPVQKIIREYDEKGRVDKIILFNEADSILQDYIYEFDNRGIEIRDSILIANGIEIPQKSMIK